MMRSVCLRIVLPLLFPLMISCSLKNEHKLPKTEFDSAIVNKLKRDNNYSDFGERSHFYNDSVIGTAKQYIIDSLRRDTSDFLYSSFFDVFNDTMYSQVTLYDKKSLVFEPLTKAYEFDSVKSLYIDGIYRIRLKSRRLRAIPNMGRSVIKERDLTTNRKLLDEIIKDLENSGHEPSEFYILKISVNPDQIKGLDEGSYYELAHKSYARHLSQSYDSGFIYYKIDTLKQVIISRTVHD
jgi:hypothetical protein